MLSVDRDWANLPSELLGSIAERLTVTDYIRFGAVCTSWASTASPGDGFFLPLAPQMPWLLLLGDEGERGESGTLVSLPDGRCRRIAPLPELRGKWCIGSQDGWLALMDERSEVSLLNLLTRAQIHLPSVTTIPDVNPIYKSDGSLEQYLYSCDPGELFPYTFEEFRRVSFKKIVLSSRPAAGNYTAMAIFSGYNVPAFAKAGGEEWTLLNHGPAITDIIYHDGKFLAISNAGQLWAFDVTGPSPHMTMIAKGWGCKSAQYDKYLVDSSGDLLLIWRGARKCITVIIKVMKFYPKSAAWVPLRSLGYNSIFLGLCYSISLSSREIPELKPNCIFLTQILWDGLLLDERNKLTTRDVCIFNLEDGSFDRYTPPDPRLNWPSPLWIAPSLL